MGSARDTREYAQGSVGAAKIADCRLRDRSSGLASVPHFTYERLRLQTGLTLIHVPYKGSGAALADLVAGQIQLAMNSVAPAIPLVQGNRIRGLGVAAASRLRQLPDVQTFNEAGLKDFTAAAWYGVLAPKGTPRAIVVLHNREIAKALAMPEIGERFSSQALEITPGTPSFRREIAAETERWKVVIGRPDSSSSRASLVRPAALRINGVKPVTARQARTPQNSAVSRCRSISLSARSTGTNILAASRCTNSATYLRLSPQAPSTAQGF